VGNADFDTRIFPAQAAEPARQAGSDQRAYCKIWARAVALDLEKLTIRELLSLWAGVLRELKRRDVVRTFNSPIGDIAEELVALQYKGDRGSFSQKTWDVRIGDEYLQVKGIRRVDGRSLGNLSPVRSDEGYDAVIAVVFTEDVRVEKAIRIPREVVNELFPVQPRVNWRSIRLTNRLLEHDGVEEIPLSDSALGA